jgi:hypothetical protein
VNYRLRGLGADVLSTAGAVAYAPPPATAMNMYLSGLQTWIALPNLAANAQAIFGESPISVLRVAGFLTPVAVVAWLMFGRGGGRGR